MPQRRSVLLGGVALLLGACGGGPDVADTDSTEAPVDAEPAAEAQQDTTPEAEADPPPAEVAELTAEDGFAPLHDFDLPEPGRATLIVAGETIDLRIRSCTNPDLLIPDEGASPSLFSFSVEAEGETADGREVLLAARRGITTMELSGSGFHDLEADAGQSRGALEIFTQRIPGETENGLADLWSPSSADPTGERLPILHVDASRAFTADEEIPARTGSPEGSLEGRFQLAGRC